tara:strand:+ start:1901 stop:2455 length:555 start_codon:yes stop_codon:yes gene_type:complete
VRVISNVRDAFGIQRALKARIPHSVIDHLKFKNRTDFEARLNEELVSCSAELVCLAGFMRLLTGSFVKKWHGRLVNIHPSLLPAFKGLDTHARALAAGVKIAGCTIHYVSQDMDAGPIIAQAAVPVMPNDSEDILAARILQQEHIIFPLALKMIAEGRVKIKDGHVLFDEISLDDSVIISPRLN